MGIKVRSPAEGIRLARKKWHKQKVLSELSHIVRMLNGSSPSWLYLYKNRPDLLYAMERYFGSLNRAKQALGLKCNQKQKRFHLPPEAKKITPTLGYLFGAYLGDGLKTAERKIEFSCGDEDFARAISRCITDWLGRKPRVIIKNNIYIVRICGVEVKKFFRFLEEDFSWIKNAPTEVKVAILRGLWDSEGTVGRKMLLFAVTDKRIAELFCMLCSELGIETKSYYYSYICQVHIHKLEDRIKFYNRVGMTSKKKMKRFWKSLNRGKTLWRIT